MQAVDHKYVPQEGLRGARALQVATLLEVLSNADNKPVPFDEMCSEAGVKYPQDIQAAMDALEIGGAVKRYSFVKQGSTRKQVAYALVEGVDVEDPS